MKNLHIITLGWIILLLGSSVQSEVITIGDQVSCDLSSGSPIRSFEFLPATGGYLQVDLIPDGTASSPVRFLLFQCRTDGSESIIASKQLLQSQSDLQLFIQPTPGLWHRAVLCLDENFTEGKYLFRIQGMDTCLSAFLVKNSTRTTLVASGTQNSIADLPVPGTGTFLFSPDGNRLLTGHLNHYQLYHTPSGNLEGDLLTQSEDLNFFFIPGQERLLMVDYQAQTTQLLSIPDLSIIAEFPGTRIAQDPRSGRVGISGATTAFIIDSVSGEAISRWEPGEKTRARKSPDGETIIFLTTESAPFYLHLFNMQTGDPLGNPLEWNQIDSVTYSPDGRRIVVIGKMTEDTLYRAVLISAINGEIIQGDIVSSHTLGAIYSPQSHRLVLYPPVDTSSGMVLFIDCINGTILRRYNSYQRVQQVQFHPEGRSLLIQGKIRRDDLIQDELKLLDAETGLQQQQYNPLEISRFAYSSIGDRFFVHQKAFIENDILEEIQLLDSSTGLLIRSDEKDWSVSDWTRVLFSANGSRMVTQNDSTLYIRSILRKTSDGSQLFLDGVREVSVFIQYVEMQGFSPDSTRYYSLGGWATSPYDPAQPLLRLVNLETGRRVCLDIKFQEMEYLQINPEGTYLLYYGKRSGQSEKQIEVIRLSDAKISTVSSLLFSECQGLNWSGDGKRILANLTDMQGFSRVALIDFQSFQVLQLYQADFGAEFDNTLYPHFPDYDFNQNGKVDAPDLFELSRILDPDYLEIYHDFQSQSQWRNP